MDTKDFHLSKGEVVAIVKQNPFFTSLASFLTLPRNTRLRALTPSRDFQGDWAENLGSDAILWLKRVYAHVPETRSIPCGQNMTLRYLLNTVLHPKTLQNHEDAIRDATTTGNGLSALTYRRGYICLVTALNVIAGGHNLSKLPTFLHAAFRQAINKLQDLAAAWNGQCVQASNVTESSRIRHALTGPAPVAILIRCFYLLEVSIMEFDILCERVHVLNQEELVYALGFFVFAFVLARPVTRVEVITKAEVHQYSMELAQKEHTEELLATTFEGHKTSSSYGSLLCLYPRWFVSILARYLRIIRPALLKTDVWGHTSHAKLFPASLTRYLNAFLMKTVGAALTANNIRQKVCECVGLLTPTDAFFDQRHALQATAAHQSVTSRVVDINYTWSTKAQRERGLQAYVDATFHRPARQLVREHVRDHLGKQLGHLLRDGKSSALPVLNELDSLTDLTSADFATRTRPALPVLNDLDSLTDPTPADFATRTRPALPVLNDLDSLTDPTPADFGTSARPALSVLNDLDSLTDPIFADFGTRTRPALPALTLNEFDSYPLVLEDSPNNNCVPSERPAVLVSSSLNSSLSCPSAATAQPNSGSLTSAPIELTRDNKTFLSDLKESLRSAFNENYLVSDAVVQQVLADSMLQFDIQPPIAIVKSYNQQLKTALKNWTNSLPCKRLVSTILEQKLDLNVATIKSTVSRDKLERLLKHHYCFQNRGLSDAQIQRFRKDVEQRLMNYQAHLAIGESPGPAPDRMGEWNGLVAFRRCPHFNFTRFEDMEIQPIDYTTACRKDYIAKISQRQSKKRKAEADFCQSPPAKQLAAISE